MKLSLYKEDVSKRESGSPCYLGDGYFNVMRINTPDYYKQIEDIKKRLYGFSPKDMDSNEIIGTWLSEHGVTGWDGIIDGDDDKELPYSKKSARKIFLNPAYFLSLNALLIQHASDYNNYLFDAIETDINAAKKN